MASISLPRRVPGLLTAYLLRGGAAGPLRGLTAWFLAVALLLAFAHDVSSQQWCPDGQCYSGAQQWRPVQGRPGVQRSIRYDPPWPAMCRVSVAEGGGATSEGSGTLVYESDAEAWVLSCYHLVRDAYRRSGEYPPVQIRFPGGKRFTGRVVGKSPNPNRDLLVIKCRPTGIAPVVIRHDKPAAGERLWVAGYGGGRFAWQVGTASYRYRDQLVSAGTQARPGDSGGPVLDTQGRLVSVISGADSGETFGCRWTPVRNILGGIWHRLRRPHVQIHQEIHQRPRPPSVETPGQGAGVPGTIPEAPDDPAPVPDPEPSPAGGDQSVLAGRECTCGNITSCTCDRDSPGPAGPRGPRGARGPQGPPGPSAEVDGALQEDIARRAAEIVSANFTIDADDLVAQLPPIRVTIAQPDGTTTTQDVRLGGTLNLKLVPVDVLGPSEEDDSDDRDPST